MKNKLKLNKIKQASIQLSQKSEKERDVFLFNLSKILSLKQKEILTANKRDVKKAKLSKLPQSFIERLTLNKGDIEKIISRINSIQRLKSKVGQVIKERVKPDGLIIRKVTTPLGVILVIYEARPEVTVDIAALCVKSGNAVILKGGSEALHTNKVLHRYILLALEESDLLKETVCHLATTDRGIVNKLLSQSGYIDLVVARGGYNLVKTVSQKSKIPVLAHSAGGARIYIDKSADLSLVKKILINAKLNKPSACNSLDTVVIHKDLAKLIPIIVEFLKENGVKVIGDRFVQGLTKVSKASEGDWSTEFLDLVVGIKVVKNIHEVVGFINKYTKRHSEGIIATDKNAIEFFVNSIDTAAVFINCSTRLHDGYVFGLGSEMGIATGKLHARGPVGLRELTTYKWEVYGNGHIRK